MYVWRCEDNLPGNFMENMRLEKKGLKLLTSNVHPQGSDNLVMTRDIRSLWKNLLKCGSAGETEKLSPNAVRTCSNKEAEIRKVATVKADTARHWGADLTALVAFRLGTKDYRNWKRENEIGTFQLLGAQTDRHQTVAFSKKICHMTLTFDMKQERDVKYLKCHTWIFLSNQSTPLKNSCWFIIKGDIISIIVPTWDSHFLNAITNVEDYWLQLWNPMDIFLYIPWGSKRIQSHFLLWTSAM